MTTHINVVIGGPSAEHEISLRTGFEILNHIDKNKYAIRAVLVTKAGEFYWCDVSDRNPTLDELTAPQQSPLFKGPIAPSDSHFLWAHCDAALLALHGTYGEDGVFQGFLDTIGIPYQGSGVFASALAMNKIASKFIFIHNGLSVPPYSVYDSNSPEVTVDSLSRLHGFPCFVKCPQSGSSRLMGRAANRAELESLLKEFQPHSPQLLVESAISGIEFTCGVLEFIDGSVQALPPVEIRPKSLFFDFTAKYTDNASDEIVPAPQSPELLERIREVALKAHHALGCSGVSRTDMILQNDILYVLETNTLPGMTSNSILPKEFKAIGGTYPGLIDTLITVSLKKRNAVKCL
jgi:D-alanine-D-alanine ligase